MTAKDIALPTAKKHSAVDNHVLMILPFPPATGAQGRKKEAIETMVEAHAALGFNVLTISLQPEQDAANPIYNRMPLALRALVKLADQKRLQKLARKPWKLALLSAIKRTPGIKFSFAYSMTGTTSRFAAQLKHFCGIPYLIHDHRTDYQRLYPDPTKFPASERSALEKAMIVLALTSLHKDQILRFARCNAEVVPLALSSDYFREFSPVRPAKNTLVTLASWTNWRKIKRLDLLLQAFALCKKEMDNLQLKIAGPVPDATQMAWAQQFIRDNHLGGAVFLQGSLTRPEIQALAYSCDICVIPSDHETFGIPATEALCAGKIVVTTRCGGPETFITEGVNGFTVATDNKIELATAIAKAVNLARVADPKVIARQARSQFSIEALQGSLGHVYNALGLLTSVENTLKSA